MQKKVYKKIIRRHKNAASQFYNDLYIIIYIITTCNDEKSTPEDKNIEKNITKDVRNLFRRKKEINDNTIKDIRKPFWLGKENKAIEDRIIKDIKNLFEHEKEKNCYKPVTISNFWSRNYVEYKCKDKIKTLSVKKYVYEILDYI